ncbi:TPA: hypothetical protein DDW69_01665 [candidate division CPR2 bacterium]|uniref:Type II secretion system F domain protein n=1 Tax=candidate division CPR2 bacterium GW2011_GWC1_41_48 TaxID=1618344 RepID=A0A0G0YJM7_UNCC2|nr:MAG: Type IV pilin [candidate division CPR2 bacterium GW2011_GWC2_39_35]KKR29438.1 MAG: Type IV pilin [candidate division CPR2 bacterium GW2011_GWD2_39_7]KKS09731.1 MAG: Type II secretion system F domain protein [candidate division CPR2 bacterium GW2011_GWC1_41_48]OGB71258.1 MAG: hypothetical protein A2Y26_00570 [candidate division CPR2 bacterium GWD2_39_7]HBG81528.1 hypothetical protein [candidate division CPR2 bacterium]
MLYKWKAVDKEGKPAEGRIEAKSQNEVLAFLKKQGLFVIAVREDKHPSKIYSKASGAIGRVSDVDRIIFTEHLATMVRSGVPLVDAFEIISNDFNNPTLKKLANDIKTNLESGKSISSSLTDYKKIFSSFYINIVRAGEESGKLDDSLRKLGIQLRKDHALKSKVHNALIYPAVLIGATLSVMSLLVIFVLPRLAGLFAQSGVKLPIFTRIVLAVGMFISERLILISILVVLMMVSFIFITKTRRFKAIISKLSLKLPKIGSLAKNVQLARFARTFSSTLSAGIPIVHSLSLTAETLNDTYRKIIDGSSHEIEKGVSLAKILKRHSEFFPNIITGIIDVGEKTGTLDELLLDIANFYDEEVDNVLKNLTAIIEPVMLIIIGFGIGGLAISIITPIYQFIQQATI